MPSPSVTASPNTQYGASPLVNQKYRPLDGTKYGESKDDRKLYGELLTNRWKRLQELVGATGLKLAAHNWKSIMQAEEGHKPPLVVVSSNRAEWIKAGVEAANQCLSTHRIEVFDNPSDLRALLPKGEPLQVSPPIYCPKRLGQRPGRNVYVVVHLLEYRYYQCVLQDTGMTVVGWEFTPQVLRRNAPLDAFLGLVGFGASRFAAIEFCKRLRQRSNRQWDYAWLLDDNVVALSNFPGFGAIENAMLASCVCSGFRGATSAEPRNANVQWAKEEFDGRRGSQAVTRPEPASPPGLLQQAVLWNIACLDNMGLNFSRVYIASGEDVSFWHYLGNCKSERAQYNGITIRKEQANEDVNNPCATRLKRVRAALEQVVADTDLSIDVTSGTTGMTGSLAEFIRKEVLLGTGLAHILNTAKCRGVEQITCETLGKGLIPQSYRDEVFKIGVGSAQPQLLDVPPLQKVPHRP